MHRDDVDRYLRSEGIEHGWLTPKDLEDDSEQYLDPALLNGRYAGIIRDVRTIPCGSEDIEILVDFGHDDRVVWIKVFREGNCL